MCLSVFPAGMSTTICMPTEVRRGHEICTNGGMDSCEPPCRYWELNLCPLQETWCS